LNKSLFDSYEVSNFSILNIWNKLINKDELYGFESLEDFRHLTDLNIYKQLLKN
jgi:MurNAc alpha-1-phosphate uridylyltransferase